MLFALRTGSLNTLAQLFASFPEATFRLKTHFLAFCHMGIWIASVHAVPREGNPDLVGAKGVVVNVLVRSDSAAACRHEVARAVNSYGLDVMEIDDLEAFTFEEPTTPESERLTALARSVQAAGGVEFDVFYTYEE